MLSLLSKKSSQHQLVTQGLAHRSTTCFLLYCTSLDASVRRYSSSSAEAPSASASAAPIRKVKVTFIDGKKQFKRVECTATLPESSSPSSSSSSASSSGTAKLQQSASPSSMTLLNLALANNLDIEAACDGTCSCSTCHVYVDEEHFAKLPKATDDEEDMLDLAMERKATSRLCCQLTLTEQSDGMVLTLPAEVANQMS